MCTDKGPVACSKGGETLSPPPIFFLRQACSETNRTRKGHSHSGHAMPEQDPSGEILCSERDRTRKGLARSERF